MERCRCEDKEEIVVATKVNGKKNKTMFMEVEREMKRVIFC
jgi:hypothetical protein